LETLINFGGLQGTPLAPPQLSAQGSCPLCPPSSGPGFGQLSGRFKSIPSNSAHGNSPLPLLKMDLDPNLFFSYFSFSSRIAAFFLTFPQATPNTRV